MSEPKQFTTTHAQFIEEEGIKISELPEAIKAKLSQFDALAKQYEQEKTQNVFNKLEQLDVLIADDLLTWKQDNEIDDDEEVDNYEVKTKAQEQAEAKEKEEAEKQRLADEQRIAQEQEAAAKQQEIDALNALNESIAAKLKGRRIKRADLEALLGRAANKIEQLGSYSFRIVYLNSTEFDATKS